MQTNRRSQRRNYRRITLGLGALLASTLLVAPYLIARTRLRDSILRGVIAEPDWAISSEAASLGWVSPLTISGLQVSSSDDSFVLQIDRVSADRTWWSLWFAAEDLGLLTIDRPRLTILADHATNDSSAEPADRIELPNFAADLRDASFEVYVRSKSGEPVIEVEALTVKIGLTGSPGQKRFTVNRFSVFDRQPLTREICNDGLQLIAPVLDGEVSVTGKASLEISDLVVPLEARGDLFVKQLQMKGFASLDDCRVSLINPLTLRLVEMFAELLNLGQIPKEIRLADETHLEFELRGGRFFHESAAILIPEVVQDFELHTSGLVSLDESIDLTVTARLPVELLGDGPLAKKVSQTPVDVAVTGSISEPVFQLPEQANWNATLEEAMSDETLSPSDKQLAGELRHLIDSLKNL